MKKIFIILILIASTASFVYPQVLGEKRNHPFSGKLRVSLQGGPTFSDTDYEGLGTDVSGGAAVEYFFPTRSRHVLGINVFADVGYISGNDNRFQPQTFRTDLHTLGAGLVYSYYLTQKLVPKLFVGFSHLWYDPRDLKQQRTSLNGLNDGDLREFNYNAEAGLSYLLTDQFSFNFGFGVQVTPNDHLDGMEIPFTNKDLFYTTSFGISYTFDVEPDRDGDGIADLEDYCPDSPFGSFVNDDGCILDSDFDGIADNYDRCPSTPTSVAVDSKGCPLDSDNDGLADYLDKCPDTPINVATTANGCPVDSDSDGVPDYLDQCGSTPPGSPVDFDGCPIEDKIKGLSYEQEEELNKSENSNAHVKYNFYKEKILSGQIYTDGEIYCIQHSSWETYSKAEQIAKSLNKEGHRTFVQETFIPAQNEFRYRVRVGYFASYDAAADYIKWLR